LGEGGCDEVVEVLVVKASDIAKLLSKPLKAMRSH